MLEHGLSRSHIAELDDEAVIGLIALFGCKVMWLEGLQQYMVIHHDFNYTVEDTLEKACRELLEQNINPAG